MSAPRVGVGVFVLRPSSGPTTGEYEFITGLRLGSHGSGTLQLPGGHLEHGESLSRCAAREVEEETGLRVAEDGCRFLTVSNDVFAPEDGGRHYVTVFMLCFLEEGAGEPQVLEPQKCERWEWTTWSALLARSQHRTAGGGTAEVELFLPLRSLLDREPNLELRPGVGSRV